MIILENIYNLYICLYIQNIDAYVTKTLNYLLPIRAVLTKQDILSSIQFFQSKENICWKPFHRNIDWFFYCTEISTILIFHNKFLKEIKSIVYSFSFLIVWEAWFTWQKYILQVEEEGEVTHILYNIIYCHSLLVPCFLLVRLV